MKCRTLRGAVLAGAVLVLCACDGKKQDNKDVAISQEMVQAIVQDKPEAVKNLLDNGESVEATQNGQTALHMAAMNGKVDILTILIARGANVNGQDDQGITPLMLAARDGHVDAVQALVAQGAKIEVQDKLGENALHIAASHGKRDVVAALLDRGANIRATTNAGLNALVFSLNRIAQPGATKSDTELVEFIKSKYGDGADTVKPTVQTYDEPSADKAKPSKKKN
ncbi:MAG TPA: ankyrin repeat domain-containing protein [Fibrobacteria bacterium]|nr:ankyrin repeat domain-containing protein [Fibrobacteria bacterium]